MKEFVKNLTADQQEELVLELWRQHRLEIRIEAEDTYGGIADVFDNSTKHQILTSILIEV